MIALAALLLLLHASALPPVPELVELIQGRARVDGPERARHLKLLAGSSLESLRSRLHPATRLLRGDSVWTVRVEQPAFDARNRLVLELRGSVKTCSVEAVGSAIVGRPRAGGPLAHAATGPAEPPPRTPRGRG